MPKNSWKQKLQALLDKLLPSKQDTIYAAQSALSILMIVCSLGYLVIKAPAIHTQYLRAVVGSKVYMIKGALNSGGGTGFEVKAPSGQSYIVTNSHVCDHVKDITEDKHSALIVDDAGNHMFRRIISISDQTDLCLIEGLPGVQGLSLGDEPSIGDTLTAVGHPLLEPLSLSSGEMTGAEDIQILDFVFPTGTIADMFMPVKDGKCDQPKNEIKEVPVPELGISVKLCFVTTKGAFTTSLQAFPGNSGSPVVDWRGRVVAVVFATSGRDNHGSLVSYKDLKDFLSKY